MIDNNALLEFVTRWRLDDRATRLLNSASLPVQERVIRSFSPNDVSRGASAALTAFVRSVARGEGNNYHNLEVLQKHVPLLVIRRRNGGAIEILNFDLAQMYLDMQWT